jgi:hypothetical protein
MEWKHGEKGPRCFCGSPTNIMIDDKSGEVNLLCLTHTSLAGALFPLPKDDRPENWPTLTDEEMIVLVDKGYEEQGAQPGVFGVIAVPDELYLPDNKDVRNLN